MYWGPSDQIYKLWGMFLIQKQEPTVEGQERIQVCDRSWEASCRLRGLQLVSLCIPTVLLGRYTRVHQAWAQLLGVIGARS